MPATAAFFNTLAPKWSQCLRPGNGSPSNIEKGTGPPRPLQRSGWRAPRAWNDSSLLRSGSHVGSEVEDGGVGMVEQVHHCSVEGARETVEEHLQWSGWRR